MNINDSKTIEIKKIWEVPTVVEISKSDILGIGTVNSDLALGS